MSASAPIGYRDERVAKMDAVIAANPGHANRILGKRVYVQPAKVHHITVNCLTGVRTVTTAVDGNPFGAPRPPIVLPAFPVAVYRPTVFRPDGVRRILTVVAKHWGVGVPSLVGPSRMRPLVYPRFAAMKLISERMNLSLTPIGIALGKRDHTTIMHGIRRADFLHENDIDWRQRYDAAEAELKSAETDRAGSP